MQIASVHEAPEGYSQSISSRRCIVMTAAPIAALPKVMAKPAASSMTGTAEPSFQISVGGLWGDYGYLNELFSPGLLQQT